MSVPSEDVDDLVRRAEAGEPAALAELFQRHGDRLRRMVRLRLDRRLQERVDPRTCFRRRRSTSSNGLGSTRKS
jgi:hypothetical protein